MAGRWIRNYIREMKTPLQELLQYESDLTNMFDSDVRVAGAMLEYIRTNKRDMLKKEQTIFNIK